MALRRNGELLHRRYQVQSCIGQGAMGAVYLVDDRDLPGARWALKELELPPMPEHERDQAVELFRAERNLLAGLIHPGIPRVVDCFTEVDGGECMVMEFIDGLPLDEILAGLSRPLLPIEALPIALQITHVLDYLHRQQPPIIFRDLKPSNLMVTGWGRVYFIDFGIARRHRSEQARDTQQLGTPGFCAPEQYGHGQTTPRSDIYAVGTTLFHLLTREDPQQYTFKFPRVSQTQPCPELLEVAIARCLQLRPEDRYESGGQLREVLEQALLQAEPPPTGSTQALGLYYLSHHAKALQPPRQGFWKEWFKRTFLAET